MFVAHFRMDAGRLSAYEESVEGDTYKPPKFDPAKFTAASNVQPSTNGAFMQKLSLLVGLELRIRPRKGGSDQMIKPFISKLLPELDVQGLSNFILAGLAGIAFNAMWSSFPSSRHWRHCRLLVNDQNVIGGVGGHEAVSILWEQRLGIG